MVNLYLDRFRKWLDFKTPGAMIGYANNCMECPIALWLLRDLGLQNVIVDKQRISWLDSLGNYTQVDTPGWISRFITLVDDPDESFVDVASPVYREEAIEALNVVEGVN